MTSTLSEKNLSTLQRMLLVALALTLLVLSAWGLHATLTSRVDFALWDFYVPWYGLHGMLHDGINPYGERVSLPDDWYALGRPTESGESEIVLELGYPLFAVVLIGPLTFLPLPWAQAVWLAVLELCFFLIILFAPHATAWRPSIWLLALVTIISLGLYHTAWAIFLGQMSIVIAAFVTLAWWGLRTERWVLAGVCLALSTTKPQMVLLFVPGVLIWAAYLRHWRLVIAFAITMGLLILSPMPWQPIWPLDWLNAMQRYSGYTLFPSVWLAAGVAALLLIWTVYRWWLAPQREGAVLNWSMGMLLVITMLTGPRTTYVNQIVLLLPLYSVFRQLARPGIIISVGLVLLVGPWALDLLFSPPLNSPEHLLWQHRVINPILPVGLAIALLALSPRAARRGGDELA